MPQHLLHAAQVGPALQEVGGEGVAHVVRRERLVEPGRAQGLLEHLADGIGGHAVAAGGHEEERALLLLEQPGAPEQLVGAHGGERQVVQRHDALPRPLAEHLHLATLEIDVVCEQARRLGHARAARVQELQQRQVAQVGGRLLARVADSVPLAVHREQPRHVGWADDVRQVLLLAGAREHARRVAVAHVRHVEPAEEAAQRREPPVDGGARVLRAVELAQVAAQLSMGGRKGVDALPGSPAHVVHEVDAVGTHRMHRGVALYAQGVAETLDEGCGARIACGHAVVGHGHGVRHGSCLLAGLRPAHQRREPFSA